MTRLKTMLDMEYPQNKLSSILMFDKKLFKLNFKIRDYLNKINRLLTKDDSHKETGKR